MHRSTKASSHSVNAIIAASSTVMDFLFWLLRERRCYPGTRLDFLSANVTWVTYFHSVEKNLSSCVVPALFLLTILIKFVLLTSISKYFWQSCCVSKNESIMINFWVRYSLHLQWRGYSLCPDLAVAWYKPWRSQLVDFVACMEKARVVSCVWPGIKGKWVYSKMEHQSSPSCWENNG